MNERAAAHERHDKTVRAWLLSLLRFAVTRDNNDRLAALAAASEIDKLNAPQGGPSSFRFFYRTSADVCAAISDPRPGGEPILRGHLEQMTDERMRRAFAAALELDQVGAPAARATRTRERSTLWTGLATADPKAERS